MDLTKDKSIKMSLPKERDVHGFTVRKVTMGEYLTALKETQELPQNLLDECFGNLDMNKAMNILLTGKQEEAVSVAVKLFMKAPEPLIRLLCEIMRIDPERALQELTPSEMLDVVKAFWELNSMNDFFTGVWSAVKPRLRVLQNIGSSVG